MNCEPATQDELVTAPRALVPILKVIDQAISGDRQFRRELAHFAPISRNDN
jgi:hypothetical protein